MDAIGKDIVKRFDSLTTERSVWENHWNEVAEQVWPAFSGAFRTAGAQTPGEKRTSKMFDSTAPIALTRFGSVMESLLTPRNSTWHRVIASDPVLRRNHNVQMWFDELTRKMFQMRYATKANYASQLFSHYLFLGAFGTGVTFLDAHEEGGFRYKAEHLSDIYIMENHQGIVDTAYRVLRLEARQAVKKFGAERLPSKIVTAAEKGSNDKHEFIHCVAPREDLDPTRVDARGMKFKSIYVCKDNGEVVQEGGYRTFPFLVSRYVQGPGEVYGRSPGMLALPTIKTLNEQKKTVLKQGQRVVDPVLLAHDQGVVDTFSLKSGAINPGAVSADGRALVQTLPTGNVAVGHQMMDQERAIINDVFLVTLFQILVDSPQMTATEVLERTREKGILLSPTVGRQQSELLGPQIERELDLMVMQNAMPPMPQELIEAQGEYEIQYDSPLSRAQKAEEAAGLFRTLDLAERYTAITGNPEPFDHINMDAAMPDVMEINAVPAKWRNPQDRIDQIRQGRQQDKEIQTTIQALPGAAGMVQASKP